MVLSTIVIVIPWFENLANNAKHKGMVYGIDMVWYVTGTMISIYIYILRSVRRKEKRIIIDVIIYSRRSPLVLPLMTVFYGKYIRHIFPLLSQDLRKDPTILRTKREDRRQSNNMRTS